MFLKFPREIQLTILHYVLLDPSTPSTFNQVVSLFRVCKEVNSLTRKCIYLYSLGQPPTELESWFDSTSHWAEGKLPIIVVDNTQVNHIPPGALIFVKNCSSYLNIDTDFSDLYIDGKEKVKSLYLHCCTLNRRRAESLIFGMSSLMRLTLILSQPIIVPFTITHFTGNFVPLNLQHLVYLKTLSLYDLKTSVVINNTLEELTVDSEYPVTVKRPVRVLKTTLFCLKTLKVESVQELNVNFQGEDVSLLNHVLFLQNTLNRLVLLNCTGYLEQYERVLSIQHV